MIHRQSWTWCLLKKPNQPSGTLAQDKTNGWDQTLEQDGWLPSRRQQESLLQGSLTRFV